MTDTGSQLAGIPTKQYRCVSVGRQGINDIKRWLFLRIWCSHLYRPTMKLLHRFNLHYAPVLPISPVYGEQNHWCQWCGLRGTTYKYDPKAPLRFIPRNE